MQIIIILQWGYQLSFWITTLNLWKWNEWKITANKSNELKQKPLQLKYVNDQSVFHHHIFYDLYTMIFH